MATISSILPCPGLLQHSSTSKPKQNLVQLPSFNHGFSFKLKTSIFISTNPPLTKIRAVVAEDTSSSTTSSSGEGGIPRLYIGNIPRNINNDELRRIVEEHGAVEKAEVMYDKYSGRSRRFGFATMKSVEDANTVIEKLNDTEIDGRKIKVNITEKPLQTADSSVFQTEETQFVDSPYKVYVGNLAKTVTSELLKDFFSEKGKVLSAKVQRTPGTSKSSGYGFVSFSSEEEVEAAIEALNNAVLEGQKVRVNKA
ncbi:hypothetical protein BVRB_3g065590 [Beta vulgaris subsp. vulgaris]|uniref:Small ribosomal subunit protein cS22 n=1 Tax=Beta vulgaris subsp. vulgaris TaxID=3555 RepID=A0A0J8CM43_BETVV|nr:hypothetical protein BVRB_3g065590 [Beta vulgaris subsp. vulgaris]